MTRTLATLFLLLLACLATSAHAADPLGLPQSDRGPAIAAQVDLGRALFFDARLSANNTVSCATCHSPHEGFTQNGPKTPSGIGGSAARRNAPSLYNVAFVSHLFHDGRAAELEELVWSVLLDPNEMGNLTRASVVERLANLDDYPEQFQRAFAEQRPADVPSTGPVTEANVGHALAAYQRTLVSADSPFDRWFFGGDSTAVSADAKHGFALFVTSRCGRCHTVATGQALFTDNEFHNTGVGDRTAGDDRGREEVTGKHADLWRYRTPSLRNVALSAPYMHDGSMATLDAVVAYYVRGGTRQSGQDPTIQSLNVTPRQRSQLLAFLRSLTGSNIAALAPNPVNARTLGAQDAR